MKTEVECDNLVTQIYDMVEHGKMKQARNLLRTLQLEAHMDGLNDASEVIKMAERAIVIHKHKNYEQQP